MTFRGLYGVGADVTAHRRFLKASRKPGAVALVHLSSQNIRSNYYETVNLRLCLSVIFRQVVIKAEATAVTERDSGQSAPDGCCHSVMVLTRWGLHGQLFLA